MLSESRTTGAEVARSTRTGGNRTTTNTEGAFRAVRALFRSPKICGRAQRTLRAGVLGGLRSGVTKVFSEVVEGTSAAAFARNTRAVVADSTRLRSDGVHASSRRAVESSPADFTFTSFLKILAQGVSTTRAGIGGREAGSAGAEVTGRTSCGHVTGETGARTCPSSFTRFASALTGEILVLTDVAGSRSVHSRRGAGVADQALLALHDAGEASIGREGSRRAAVVVGTTSSSRAEVPSRALVGNEVEGTSRAEVAFSADLASSTRSGLLRRRVRSGRAGVGETSSVGAVVTTRADDSLIDSSGTKRTVLTSNTSSATSTNITRSVDQAVSSSRAGNGDGSSRRAVGADGAFVSGRSWGGRLGRAGVARSTAGALERVVGGPLTSRARNRIGRRRLA